MFIGSYMLVQIPNSESIILDFLAISGENEIKDNLTTSALKLLYACLYNKCNHLLKSGSNIDFYLPVLPCGFHLMDIRSCTTTADVSSYFQA